MARHEIRHLAARANEGDFMSATKMTVTKAAANWARLAVACALFVFAFPSLSIAADDAYRPPSDQGDVFTGGQGGNSADLPPAGGERYEPYGQQDNGRRSGGSSGGGGGYGEPYPQPSQQGAREERYEQLPPDNGPYDNNSRGYYTQSEIVRAGHGFFGTVSGGLASAVEWAFQKAGRPNGYILGQDAGGAIVAGLRYGEGTLHTKDAGTHKVFWQGPSVGYDFGAEGSKVMTLVYNMSDPADIYARFGGVEGSAYLVGGVSVQLQKAGQVTLAPIRSGVGLRLGANVGYLKYTRNPSWNPF